MAFGLLTCVLLSPQPDAHITSFFSPFPLLLLLLLLLFFLLLNLFIHFQGIKVVCLFHYDFKVKILMMFLCLCRGIDKQQQQQRLFCCTTLRYLRSTGSGGGADDRILVLLCSMHNSREARRKRGEGEGERLGKPRPSGTPLTLL